MFFFIGKPPFLQIIPKTKQKRGIGKKKKEIHIKENPESPKTSTSPIKQHVVKDRGETTIAKINKIILIAFLLFIFLSLIKKLVAELVQKQADRKATNR